MKRVLSALVVMFSVVSGAHAEDGKVYPATMCQGSLVGTPSIITYTGKSVRNNSTTNSAVVACPIVKDDVFSLTGGNQAMLRFCKPSSQGLNSSLYSYSSFGTSSYLSSKWDFDGAGCRTISHGAISSYSQGYYTLLVTMPPSTAAAQKTEIFSYRFDEN